MALSQDVANSPFLAASAGGPLLRVHVVPGAAHTEIVGLHGDRLKIKVRSRPHDGAANRELLRFVCEELAIKSSQIELVSGASSRRKSLLLPASAAVLSRAKALAG